MHQIMLRDEVMFVGGGQYGGNQVMEFMKYLYVGFVFNTSILDLNTLNIPKENKFHVPTAEGCGKDLELAQHYAETYKGQIVSTLTTRFPQFKHTFFCYSGGGGTGCGMSPIIMRELKRVNPDISIHAIVAIPSDSDSIKAKHNALKCIIDVGQMLDEGILNNVYFINNNDTTDVISLNHRMVGRLLNLFSITSEDVKGIIDSSEIKKVLGVKGCVSVYDIKTVGSDDDKHHTFIRDSLLAKSSKGGNRFIYTQHEDDPIDVEDIYKSIGKLIDYYKGYAKEYDPTLYTFGGDLPHERISQLQSQFNNDKQEAYNNNVTKFGVNIDISLDDKLSDFADNMLQNLFK